MMKNGPQRGGVSRLQAAGDAVPGMTWHRSWFPRSMLTCERRLEKTQCYAGSIELYERVGGAKTQGALLEGSNSNPNPTPCGTKTTSDEIAGHPTPNPCAFQALKRRRTRGVS